MSPDQWSLLALQLGLILAAAFALGQIFRWLGQPSIAGELLGGVLLGPTVLGRLAPDAYHWILPQGDVHNAREAILRVGMLFFIFTIGADISLKKAFHVRKEALSIGVAGTLTPLALGFAIALLLPAVTKAPPGQEVALAGFFGAILSLSANPVIARILIDLGLYKEKIGVLIMSSTLVDDLVGWGLFAVVLAQFAPGRVPNPFGPLGTIAKVAGAVAAILLVGRLLVPKLLKATKTWGKPPTPALMLLMAFTLLAASAAEAAGVHSFLGAFLAGLALSDNVTDFQEAFQATSAFTLAIVTPIFFFTMGVSADFLADFDLALVATVTCVAFFGKIAGVYIGGRLVGLDKMDCLAVGAGLNARGILGLLMASSALESKLIDQRTYVACVVMCLATTIAAGPTLSFFTKKKLLPIPTSHA